MSVYNLNKLKKLKREDWVMSFEIFWKKYEERIDYSLMASQQIEKMIWTDVFLDDKGNVYVSRLTFK